MREVKKLSRYAKVDSDLSWVDPTDLIQSDLVPTERRGRKEE